MFHQNMKPADGIHSIHSWVSVNVADRLALDVAVEDIGKVCYQMDTQQFWVLSAFPASWLLISATGGAALVGQSNEFTANQYVTPRAVTVDGTSLRLNALLSNNWSASLTANYTLENPTNLAAGMVLNINLDQDAVGGHLLSYGSLYKAAAGQSLAPSLTASSKNTMSCYYDGTILRCSMSKEFA